MAPQHRYERQNLAECGELLRNASILMTRHEQASTRRGAVRRFGVTVDDGLNDMVRTGMGSYMDTGDQPSTSAT